VRSPPDHALFDWAADAKPRWLIPDGIHYYFPGYLARAHLIALSADDPPPTTCAID
jgi:hypothetical protein